MSFMRSLAVYARLPDPRPLDQIDEEIRDELEFHIHMRTLDGVRAGLAPDEARQEAMSRFGDLARIERDCRRILAGDRIMLQRFQAVLTLLLVAAVAFLAVRFYQYQRASEVALAKMNETLERMAAGSHGGALTPAELTAVYAGSPPVVLETIPTAGASDVDPATTEIHATFSKPMQGESWSWCFSPEDGPETGGEPHYLPDGKTCVLPVKLKPGTTYQIWLNSEEHSGFRDRSGRAAVPYCLVFTTRK